MAIVGTPLVAAKALYDFIRGDFKIEDYATVFDADYTIEIGAEIHITEDGIAAVVPAIKVDGNNVIMTPFKI